MPSNQGGFLIRFDEDQRATFLREVRSLENGFSDALSREDWAVRQWEVCGLLFEPQVVTHWALARKGKGVATGKVRVEFTEVTSTLIPLAEVERRVGPQILKNIVRARAGVGGRGLVKSLVRDLWQVVPSCSHVVVRAWRQRTLPKL